MLTSGSCLAMHAAALVIFFFFNDTATTEIYTLSLHDALPISRNLLPLRRRPGGSQRRLRRMPGDRKSTRLNSSHQAISYAVFCLKKNKNAQINDYNHKSIDLSVLDHVKDKMQ